MIACIAAAAMIQSSTVLVANRHWIMFEKKGSKWTVPGKSIDKKNHTWTAYSVGVDLITFEATSIAEDIDARQPNMFETDKPIDEVSVVVSGGKASFLPARKLSATNEAYVKIGEAYAKAKKRKVTIELQDVTQVDLNNDGEDEVIVSIGAAREGENPAKQDFTALILRTVVNGKVKQITLDYEAKTGYMRGPYQMAFLGAGDFDGDGTKEFLVRSQDPWGTMVYLMRLSKSGKVTKLATAGWGE